MQCLESTLGAEAYFAALAVAVGAIMNAVKRIKFVPGDVVPALAFVAGWSIDFGLTVGGCGLGYLDAALGGLGGGLAGLAAAGGHEALSRTANAVGMNGLADKLLGKAKSEQDKRKSKSSGSTALLLVALSGCSLLPALVQGAQWLGTVIDVADSGADAFFARHPSLEAESKVDAHMHRARLALAALDAALAAGGDTTKARAEALASYAALRTLLADLGVLSATSPAGGAETDAPKPEPFNLPSPDEVLPQ
jgi:hypothetical protein